MKPDSKILADFCARMEEQLAPFAEVGNDLKTNIRAVAEVVLGKMDVVSRAELDEQNALLAEAATKLAELEEKINALEREKNAAEATSEKKVKNAANPDAPVKSVTSVKKKTAKNQPKNE